MAIETLIKAQEVINGGIFKPTPFNARFDPLLIQPLIKQAERRFVKPILCNDLYEQMISEQNAAVSNYNPTLGAIVEKFPTNAVFEALWRNVLLEMEGFAVYHQALPHIAVQVGSNGVMINDSQFAENAGIKGLKFLLQENEDTIRVLEEDLGNYLCQNKEDFDSSLAFQCKCVECESCSCGCDPCECQGLDNKMVQKNARKQAGIVFYSNKNKNKYRY